MKNAVRLALLSGTGAVAAGAARGAYTALRRHPPAGHQTWTRTNHRGEPVTLLEGPALTAGALTAQLIAAAAAARLSAPEYSERGHAVAPPAQLILAPRPAPNAPVTTAISYLPLLRRGAPRLRATSPASQSPGTVGSFVQATVYDIVNSCRGGAGRAGLAAAVAGLGGGAFGLLDDLRGSAKQRGLRGHLGALAHGEVTTGSVKLAGLAATGLAAALLEGGDPADVAINASLVAGGANLLNLFDLRPGRAVKVAALSAAGIAAGGALSRRSVGSSPGDGSGFPGDRSGGRLAGLQAVAAPMGAALALLPEDLQERAMLGDAGANALGAMLGAAAAATLPRSARAGLLAGIVALTVASEKVSFTKVIAATPPLNWLDMLGRRPAPAAPFGAPAAVDTAAGGAARENKGAGSKPSENTSVGDRSAESASTGSGASAGASAGSKGSENTGVGDATASDADAVGSAVAGLAPGQRWRRRPGRHRRAGSGDGRSRSGSVFSFFLKTVTRREP